MTRMMISPIAIREMRARMRGPRAFIILFGYLTLLGLIIFLVYLRSGGGSSYSYPQSTSTISSTNLGPTVSFQIGQNIFLGIFLFLLVVVSVVTPTITAGSISREVESRTYDLLLLTPAHGRMLAFGKLFAALAFVFFLLLSALPFLCIVFVFGGVDFGQVVLGLALLFLTAFAYGVIGLFFSTLFHRTALALIFTYCLIFLLTFGSSLLSSSMVSLINQEQKVAAPVPNLRFNLNNDPSFDVPKRILLVNPLAALGSILAPNAPYRGAAGEDLQYFPNSSLFGGNVSRYYSLPNYQRFQASTGNTIIIQPTSPPLWAGYVLIYVVITLTFWLLSLTTLTPGFGRIKKPRLFSKKLKRL